LAVIELIGVSKWFGISPRVVALRDVSLTIAAGEYVAIVGPSGSGKSTLLNIIGCLDVPSSGSYRVDERVVSDLSAKERTAFRSVTVGFVFQAFHLIPHLSALENASIGVLYQGVHRKRRMKEAFDVLERVGLAGRADFLPRQLSGGEQQRVAIARALLARPAVLLCDEPTGNLDSQTSADILDLLDELRAGRSMTIAVVTHDPIVSQRTSRIVHLVDGRIGGPM